MATLPDNSSLSRQTVLGTIFAALAAVGFSAKAILVKLAYASPVDAVTLLAIRMAFSVPFFIVVAWWSSRNAHAIPLARQDWFAVLALGLIGYYLSSLLDFSGLQYISAGLERLILFLYPTLVVLLSAALFKRRIGRREIFALVLSYAGILLVFMQDVRTPQDGLVLGAALVFASTLTYSIYLFDRCRPYHRADRRHTLYSLCDGHRQCRHLSAICADPSAFGLGASVSRLRAGFYHGDSLYGFARVHALQRHTLDRFGTHRAGWVNRARCNYFHGPHAIR